MFYHHNRKGTNVYDQDQVGLISVWGESPCQQSSPPPQPTLFIEVASLTESETQQPDETSYPSKHRRSSWLYLSGIRTIGTYILPCLAFWHGCWGIWTYVCAVGTLWTEILSQPSCVHFYNIPTWMTDLKKNTSVVCKVLPPQHPLPLPHGLP